MSVPRNKIFYILTLIALSVGAYITVQQSKNPQETRSRAAVSATASTILYFTPASTGTNPLQKQVGENFKLDLMVDPGNNLISFLRLQIKFNKDKLKPSQLSPFTPNTQAFPVTVEGPIVAQDTISVTLGIGSDGTKAIQTPTKVGTFSFDSIGETNGTTTLVSFTNLTQALSIGPNDKAYESVLSSTTPATIIIGGSGSITHPVISQTVTGTLTNPPQPSGSESTVSFELLLHGVGSAGDNPNPSGSSLSNKLPINPQRDLEVTIFDSNNIPVSTTSGAVNYDIQSGTFKGSIPFNKALAKNTYVIKIKTPRYLRKRIPKVWEIIPGRDNKITKIDLVAGDTNNDNHLDIRDYNAFLDCGYGDLEPLPNDDANSAFNSKNCQNHKPPENIDINDDGIINSTDYNLFLRELSVQIGD